MKPDTRPHCACGRLLLREDISSNARGSRICGDCARQQPHATPSPEAQRVMDAMNVQSDYSAQARVAYVALGRMQPERAVRPKPQSKRQGVQQGLGI